MIRRTYLIPRLFLFLALVTFTNLAINPLLRRSIIRSAQQVTGAQVDIGGVRTSWRRGEVTVRRLEAADPHQPAINLFEADRVDLTIDRKALGRGRVLVENALVTGLQVGTHRDSNEDLPRESLTEMAGRLAAQYHTQGQSALQSSWQFPQLGPKDLNILPSVQMATQLESQWPKELEQLNQQSASLRDKIERLLTVIESSGENPLRNYAIYHSTLGEIDAIHDESEVIRSSLDRISQQIKMDCQQIASVRNNDLQELKNNVTVPTLDADRISEYLLGPEMHARLISVVQWLQWGKQYVPLAMSDAVQSKSRGQNVLMPGMKSHPSVLVRKMVLRGQIQMGNQLAGMEGVVTGLNSHPHLANTPTCLTIQTTDGTPLLIQATLFGTQGADDVVIDCPCLPQPARTLGNPQSIAIEAAPADAHLWARVRLSENSIDGKVVMRQSHVKMTPRIGPMFVNDHLAKQLSMALDQLRSVDTTVHVSGTIDKPMWHLESNLGPRLAGGLQAAFRDRVAAQQEEMATRAVACTDQAIAAVDAALAAKSKAVMTTLQLANEKLVRVRTHVATRVEHNDGLIDEKKPLREKFLR